MGIDAVDSPTTLAAGRDSARLVVVDLQARRGPELFGLARRLGLTPEEADDAVQETLLRVWLALGGDTVIRQVDAWCFRTLYRICMDQHRWRRRVRMLADRIRPSPVADAQRGSADRISLWQAVDRLPERQRAVIYLRYRADMTFEEIGAALDIQAVSARSHASRALDRLGELLDEEDFR